MLSLSQLVFRRFDKRRVNQSLKRCISMVKTKTSPKEITRANSVEFLSNYDTILLDCDGVLWKTDYTTAIPGIPEAIRTIRNLGKQILFVTNNSRLSREMCIRKFYDFDIDPGATEDVFCVAYAIGIYLRDVLKITGSVYNIGSQGMVRELTLLGLDNFGAGQDFDQPTQNIKDLLSIPFRNDVQAVVVAYDEYFNYMKLYKAASYLTNPSCHFVVPTYSGSGVLIGPNRFQPLTGPIVSAVSKCSGREPLLIGKPANHMFDCIKATHPSIDKSQCLMIGDSLKADIGFAKACEIDSALVLSGSNSLQSMRDLADETLLPDFYLTSLTVLA